MKLPNKRERGLLDKPRREHNRAPLKVAKRDPVTGEIKMVNRKGQEWADPFFKRLEQSMTRDEFIAIMSCAGDEKATRLFKLLMEPKYMRRTLAWMAKEAGISYAELVMLIKNQHIGEGTIRMAKHAPKVMEDVAVDSMSKEVTCATCKGHKVDLTGDGTLIAVVAVTESVYDDEKKRQVVLQRLDDEGRPMWERCLTCDGVGTLRQVGNADARKLMFETLKLTGQKGPVVAQNFNLGGGSSMEDAVGAAHDVLDVPALKESN